MRLLWITPEYPSDKCSFAGIFQQMQARALAAKGIVPEIIAPTPYVSGLLKALSSRYRTIAVRPEHETDGPIRINRPRYLTSPREYLWGISHSTQAFILRRVSYVKPSLIHAHFAYPVGAAALMLKKKWNIPLVLTLHGDDVTIHPHASPWHRKLFGRTVRSSDIVIAVSHALADETEKLTGRKPEVLSVGIDTERFQILPEKHRIRERLNLPSTAFVILYVGNLLPQKGVLDLTKAYHRLKLNESRLVFVGDGPLKPMGEGIVHLGKQPNHMIPQFLASADVLVLPSHHEGLGQVILEAGAAGVAVVGSETGGIVDLLSDERGWLFPPKDIGLLTKRLDEVKRNPEEATRRAGRLKQYVSENHELSKNADKLIALYRRVCPIVAKVEDAVASRRPRVML